MILNFNANDSYNENIFLFAYVYKKNILSLFNYNRSIFYALRLIKALVTAYCTIYVICYAVVVFPKTVAQSFYCIKYQRNYRYKHITTTYKRIK